MLDFMNLINEAFKNILDTYGPLDRFLNICLSEKYYDFGSDVDPLFTGIANFFSKVSVFTDT